MPTPAPEVAPSRRAEALSHGEAQEEEAVLVDLLLFSGGMVLGAALMFVALMLMPSFTDPDEWL